MAKYKEYQDFQQSLSYDLIHFLFHYQIPNLAEVPYYL